MIYTVPTSLSVKCPDRCEVRRGDGMNPVFVICVIISAFAAWVGSAFLFAGLGKVIKIWLNCFKYIMKEDSEEDDEDE